MLSRSLKLLALPAALALALVGCETENTNDNGAPAASAPLSEKAVAALATADAADGKTDKVVEKCLTCQLHMSGSSDHVAKVGGYELHLCSPACKEKAEKEPEKSLLALEASK